MVSYVRIGSSRIYVPKAFGSSLATARIAFISKKSTPTLDNKIDVLEHFADGTFVVFPKLTHEVAYLLAANLPEKIDHSMPADQHTQIAFLTANGLLRPERVMVEVAGGVINSLLLSIGDPNKTNNRDWQIEIPNGAKVQGGPGKIDITLDNADQRVGGFYVGNLRVPFSSTQRQIDFLIEGPTRGTFRFTIEMNDTILESVGAGPCYFEQESFKKDTIRIRSHSFPLYRLGNDSKIFTCQIDISAPHEIEQVDVTKDLEASTVLVPRSLLLPPNEPLRTALHAVHGADVYLKAEHNNDAPSGFALTASPKTITNAGGKISAHRQSHYFAPIGTFSINSGIASLQRISLGLSNLETLSVQPSIDKLTFVPGHAAYDARKNGLTQNAQSSEEPLIDFEGLCQTSWLRFDSSSSDADAKALSIQPEGMQAYRATASDSAKMTFSAAQFPAPTAPFPFAPLLAIRGTSAKQRLQFEREVIAKARRACILSGAAVDSVAPTTMESNQFQSRTPQGFIAFRSDDGANWSKLLFTRTSKRRSEIDEFEELVDVALGAKPKSAALFFETMSQNRLMLVTTWKTLLQLDFDLDAFTRMHIGGWGIQLSPYAEGDDPIVVIKYDSRPLRELAGMREQWVAPDKFDPEVNLEVRLRKIFDIANSGDGLFGKLARRIDDPNWNGLLILDAKLPLEGIPDQMRAIAAGLPNSLAVPYLGIDTSGIDPAQPDDKPWRSALFGLVNHNDQDLKWEEDLSQESQVGIRVTRLLLRIENDAIDRFECELQLRIPQLFDFKSRTNDDLKLQGRYESRISDGKRQDTYIFESNSKYVKEFGDNSIVKDIEFRRLCLVTTKSESKYTEGRFLIDGDISFNKLGDFDLLGIEKLEFTDFAIDMGFFVEGLRQLKLKFNYPNLKFDLDGFNKGKGRRSGNLPDFLRSFPLKLKGLRFGDFDLSSLGFLQLGNLTSTTQFEFGSVFKYALEFDLDLGSLGSLAKKLDRFKLQVLIGWKPEWENETFKLNRIAAGFRIDLGEGGGGIDLGLQDILRLRAERFNFKREKLKQANGKEKDLILLSADDCHLDVLGNTLPEDGKFSLFLFANLGEEKLFERPGWYASFKNEKAKPPIAIKQLVMAQRISYKLGDVTTTRDSLGWIAKQETFEKDDPDAASKFVKFAGSSGVVNYDSNRDWFIALKGTFFELFDIAVLLKDPDVYGAYVGLLAKDNPDPSKAIMSFDLLYQKLSEGVGRYVVEVGLPPGYRTFEVGVASVTIGMIRFEIFTDGGFLVDIGFPQHVDYSRSFAVQAAVFIGKGGFYLGRTNALTIPFLDEMERPNYGSVIRIGFAMKVGLGREFEYGPIRAGLSLTVFGRTEGYLAASLRHKDTGVKLAKYDYWMRLQGEVGIIAEIEGSVDLRLIRARLLIRIWIATGIVLQTALPVVLYCEAGVSVAVEFEIASFKVFGRRIRITVMLRYSTTLRFEYTLPPLALGGGGLALKALTTEPLPAEWPMVVDSNRLGVQVTPLKLHLAYDVSRKKIGELVAIPSLFWLQSTGPDADTQFPIATLARALIGWAALRSSHETQSALDITIRKGINPDPKAQTACQFDYLEQLVRDLDDVPLDKLETLLGLVLNGSRIAHVEEIGDEPVKGYMLPIPFGLRIESEIASQKAVYDFKTRGAISEQAIALLLDKFDHQFMEIGAQTTHASLFAEGQQPLVRYLFRSWCTALALAALDVARSNWKLEHEFEDRSLEKVLDEISIVQWKGAFSRAGRMLLSGMRVEEGCSSVAMFERAGLFIGIPTGDKTKLRLVAPTTTTWFDVDTSEEFGLDTGRIAAMATVPVKIVSKTVRPLTVRMLPRRFFLSYALELRANSAAVMRLARFSSDLLMQLGSTEFQSLAFFARTPNSSDSPKPIDVGTKLQKPRAAMTFELGLRRVVSGQSNETEVSCVQGAYQILGAREGDRLGLDAIIALYDPNDTTKLAGVKLDATKLYIGWREDSVDDEHLKLLDLSNETLTKVLVARSTVSLQRRPSDQQRIERVAEALPPEEIFLADFTPQLRFELLYLLQRAAIVNATGTHLLLPKELATPLDEFFKLPANQGRDRVDLMFTLVFADDAKLPEGALNSAAFELDADIQVLTRPRVPSVELAVVPPADIEGRQDDRMLEAIALRPAGTELVRTWRPRSESGGAGDATEANLANALAARFDMQEFEVTLAGDPKPLIDADDSLPQSSEEAIPSKDNYPEQMREWLAKEMYEWLANEEPQHVEKGLRYDIAIPVSKLLADQTVHSPSPYAAIGKTFKVDLSWRDVYGNRLDGKAWSGPIKHLYNDPLIPVSAWPCIQTRVFPGPAGSCELILEFAIDERPILENANLDVLKNELQRIVHQLQDPNTKITVESSLITDVKKGIQKSELANFTEKLLHRVSSKTPLRCEDKKIDFNISFSLTHDEPFCAVELSLVVERPENLVGYVDPEKKGGIRIPGAMQAKSPVRLVASTDAIKGGKESASQLAYEFQSAFTFTQAGEARKFWLARGASDHGGSQWWAIDDRVFPVANDTPAIAYAMPPLARALMSCQIPATVIKSSDEADTEYLKNMFVDSETESVMIKAVDRDVDQLMSDFLDRVEAFLSAAHAPVTASVPAVDLAKKTPFEKVALQKALLLDIRGENPPLLNGLMPVFNDQPKEKDDPAFKAAREELREACAQHLQRFYEVGCVVSKGLQSRAPKGWFTEIGNNRPKLYGQLSFIHAGESQLGFRAMTRGIPLQDSDMQLTATIISEKEQESVDLGSMHYQLTHVERQVDDAIEGILAPSRWLTIVPLPPPKENSPEPKLILPDIEVKAAGVAPFPLRQVPKNPVLNLPTVLLYNDEPASTYAEHVALARRWTFGFEVAAEFRDPDEVCGRLIYNAPVGSVPAALETSASPLVPGLFEALVVHEREVEPYWKTIISEAGRLASQTQTSGNDPELRFRNACHRFAQSVEDVVKVFMNSSVKAAYDQEVAQDRFVLTHKESTTTIKFIDHMNGDKPWSVLAGEGRPWVRIQQSENQSSLNTGVVLNTAASVEASFTYLKPDMDEKWRKRWLEIGRLDALRQQTVWATASVRRNKFIKDRLLHAEFVYRTPEVFLQELISPNLLRRPAIRLSPMEELTLNQLLIQGLAPVIGDASDLTRVVQIRADYDSMQLTQLVEEAFGPVKDEPSEGFIPEPDPKVLLAGLKVGAGAESVKIADLASIIEGLLRQMFTNEAINTRADGSRGCLVLNVTIQASEDGKTGLPVLRLERLCLDLDRETDI